MPRGCRMFVIRTIKRYQETGSVEDRTRSGRPCTVVTPKVCKAVREQIRRNPRRSMRKMASTIKISHRSVQRIDSSRSFRDEIIQKKECPLPYGEDQGKETGQEQGPIAAERNSWNKQYSLHRREIIHDRRV